jgi:pimeloyl-ACP methyl ester carboxylesterase
MQRIGLRASNLLRALVLGLSLTIMVSCAMGRWHSTMVSGAPIAWVVKGDSGPTVVFEAGLGNGMRSWEPVYEDVAKFSVAVAYSRAGYAGKGVHFDKGGRRSADDVARMLKSLLEKSRIPGPYVLVGHSIGGNYVLRFAELYRKDVAGIVLIDSRPRGFSRECKKAGYSPCGPSEIHAMLQPPHIAAEIRGLAETEEETPRAEELGGLPVTVIAATEPERGIQDLWLRMQEEFAQTLDNGRFVRAKGAGHFIHHDMPDLVVKEIRLMVEQLGNRKTEQVAADE